MFVCAAFFWGLGFLSAFGAEDSDGGFAVDFASPLGPVKELNGTNLWSKFSLASFQDGNSIAQNARFSTVRLHDCPWDNNGQRLVDVHQIFGNLNADPADPSNYYFAPTDDYLQRIVESGPKLIYRLGSTIEHTQNHYFTGPPADPEHYAEICAGIIRHYNKGWADGFHWNIDYWEIWNEPDLVPQMWKTGDFQTYCDFYVTVAKRLRKEFPTIKIGGPAITHANLEKIGQLAETCRKSGAPLDFCSWHCYAARPEDLLDPPAKVRKILDERGFSQTELHLNEWHYFPAPWPEVHGTAGGVQRRLWWRGAPEGINGYDAAGFVGYVLTRWQETPLDLANYYATGLDNWGLIGPDGDIRKPYYTFVAFADFFEQAPTRVRTADRGSISLLGGIGEGGRRALLISSWKESAETLTVRIDGAPSEGTVRVQRIDAEKNLAEETLAYNDGKLVLKNRPGSFVLLVEWPGGAERAESPAPSADSGAAAETVQTEENLPSSCRPVSRPDAWWTERFEANRARLEKGNVDLLLLGDSIVESLDRDGRAVQDYYYGDRNGVNMGFGGDRTEHLLWRLDHFPLDKISPKAILLMIGSNNLYVEPSDIQIVRGVRACVDRLRAVYPETPILLLGVTPEREHPDEGVNVRIPNLNRLIKKSTADVDRLVYRETGQLWCDEKGNATLAMTRDHCHPNEAGCKVWLADIEPILAPWLGTDPKPAF